jgi:hypothetical protein
MSLCFRARFGSPYLKAVAVALADHASDDGSKIWPSVASLAEKTEIAVRTVQYKLRDLEALGLIVCVAEGGQGAKDTREYRFDMELLQDLAAGNVEIVENTPDKDAPGAPIQGAPDAPLPALRVQLATGRVQLATNKGAPGAPEPSLNHQEPSSARTRAKVVDDLSEEGRRWRPAIHIDRADLSWPAWIAWLEREDPPLARQAAYWGELVADRRWPDRGTQASKPTVAPLPANVTGDRENAHPQP